MPRQICRAFCCCCFSCFVFEQFQVVTEKAVSSGPQTLIQLYLNSLISFTLKEQEELEWQEKLSPDPHPSNLKFHLQALEQLPPAKQCFQNPVLSIIQTHGTVSKHNCTYPRAFERWRVYQEEHSPLGFSPARTPAILCQFSKAQNSLRRQVPINRKLDKQNVAYTHFKKEENPVTCYNMDEP